MGSFFSFKGIIYLSIIAGVAYYFWPYIEAIFIILIPDPQDIKEKSFGLFKFFKDKALGLIGKASESGSSTNSGGYKKDFNEVPETLEDDDDDENDVGRPLKDTGLSFDSDEDREKHGELIDFSRNVGSDHVPKLKKPE